ncbi:hypothetical protein BRARA_E00048 [Brassica rapa]|uniref:DUF3511 domain-containing protein n=2 Tax=Brassica TaxID=3705 RepID=A0A397Z9D5_BRACM|nr:uncharacterized protein LOC103866376 [Brassica rapa]RID60854.1 hypothetical protein BRARA_E00048 [Brassica rapa]CAF2093188.1 unnamed protein product [Brassica napus]CAG7873528.1 unnamed protein product [Brassica rapa]VDC69329.1 unnamed protein product [Brassica rapa]
MAGQVGYGSGSGQRTYVVDRRTEIVSGKGYGVGGSNQIYGTQDFPPSLQTPPGEVAARRSNASSTRPSWGVNDAEMKRKKRIARYKAYTVEGKVKSTFKNGFRWIKNKCYQIVHGF